jgi:hypothetical protein
MNVLALGAGIIGQSYSFSYHFLEYFYVELTSYCILKEYALQTECLFM